jgi:NADPH:quinone reductase-like Zn-dependent oxidoreductase
LPVSTTATRTLMPPSSLASNAMMISCHLSMDKGALAARPTSRQMTARQERESAMTLNGKRIVVLGGSSGIGLATAQAAAQEGANVVIASSRKEQPLLSSPRS